MFNHRNYKFVGKKIEKLIPEVKKRNRDALIFSGGESVLMYVPSGFKDDAEFDDVRSTYRTQDVKYELVLNNQYFGCERLYGDDTDTYPSVRIAFPSNPESLSSREEGFSLINRSNAWTLWHPILPTKGVLVLRTTPFLGEMDNTHSGRELYLLENVTHSYFPINNGSGLHLLHQETPVTRVEDGVPVSISDLPTVEDTLSVYKNDLEYDLTGLTISGAVNTTDAGTVLFSGSSITTLDTYLNNKININIKPLISGGIFKVGWGMWSDSSQPYLLINRDLNVVSVHLNNLITVKQVNYLLETNRLYNLRVELSNGVFKVWFDKDLVINISFKVTPEYSTFQPLTQSEIVFESTNLEILLHKLYVMDLI